MFLNLYKEMKLRQVSQKQIAEKLEITPTSISKKLKGKSDFLYSEMLTIRDTFFNRLSMDYLFKKSPNKESGGK